MPRLDHTVPVNKRFSSNERAILLLMQDLINEVRVEVGMAPLSEQTIEQQLRQILRDEATRARAQVPPAGGN
jgi:hypothetical protein